MFKGEGVARAFELGKGRGRTIKEKGIKFESMGKKCEKDTFNKLVYLLHISSTNLYFTWLQSHIKSAHS